MQALTKAAHLKPEARLGQAIVAFQKELSKEEREAFDGQRSSTEASPPTQRDVMRLLSEVDKTSGVVAGRRCFGPRFTGILNAVQQFAALGDVVLGGSQNLIACSVWAVIRMTLLAVASYVTYLDQISSLFMSIARSAPNHESLATLVPRSKQLRTSLMEYHAIVVGICHHIWTFVHKSALKRLGMSIMDTKLTDLRHNLDIWAKAIQDSLNVLVAKAATEGSKRTADLEVLTTRGLGMMQHHDRQRKRIRLLDRCSKFQYQAAWKQLRKKGASSLISDCKQYDHWIHRPDPSTLVFTGKVGAGKSVLMASIVNDLNTRSFRKTTHIAFFFCQHDTFDSRQVRIVLGSLARQLLISVGAFHLGDGILDDETDFDPEELHEILVHLLPHDHDILILIDGLDECDRISHEEIIDWLRSLQKDFRLKICLAYRYQSPQDQWRKLKPLVTVTIPDENPDIAAYIDAELENRLEAGKLALGDAAIILEIQQALLKGAQGMFLWVTLQINALCSMPSDDGIRTALTDLPKDLPKTFSRILLNHKGQREADQRRLLELVASALRPLTKDELQEAISVVPGDPNWRPSILINDLDSMLALCGGLIVVDEEEETVRTVHHSFEQFLWSSADYHLAPRFERQTAHRTMADVIITYLSYGVFDTQVSTRVVPRMDIKDAPLRIVQSTMGQSTVRQLALRLLRESPKSRMDIGQTVVNTSDSESSQHLSPFSFITYAKAHWIEHIIQTIALDQAIVSLLHALLSKSHRELCIKGKVLSKFCVWITQTHLYDLFEPLLRDNSTQLLVEVEDGVDILREIAGEKHGELIAQRLFQNISEVETTDSHGRTMLLLAAEKGLPTVVEALLDGSAQIEARDEDGRTPLSLAAMHGHPAVLDILLKSHANKETLDRDSHSPLMLAISRGHIAIVNLLIHHKAEINNETPLGRTPIAMAAEDGHLAIVRFLLDEGAVLDVASHSASSPLVLAARKGHCSIVELLLKHQAPIESRDPRGDKTALHWAAQGGHLSTVQLLIKHGCSVAAVSRESGRTALMYAAEKGHERVVEALLEADSTCLQIKEYDWGYTTLMFAAENGNLSIVQFLVKHGGVDTRTRSTAGNTALMYAARNGHEAVTEYLLDKSDIDAQGNDGCTALMYAAASGSEATVRLLLDKVEVQIQDRLQRTAAMIAAMQGHGTIVELLLKTGKISIDATDVRGSTILMLAASQGHIGVVRVLLEYRKDQGEQSATDISNAFEGATEQHHNDIAELLAKNMPSNAVQQKAVLKESFLRRHVDSRRRSSQQRNRYPGLRID